MRSMRARQLRAQLVPQIVDAEAAPQGGEVCRAPKRVRAEEGGLAGGGLLGGDAALELSLARR